MTEGIYRKKHLTSSQVIILGFAGVILLGAFLLMLPVASAEGVATSFHEALFTSTSAVCVTGLVVQDTGSYWSFFGQTVILALIQIGGLGVVTVAAAVVILSGRKISLMQLKHYAGCDFSSQSGRDCQAHQIHFTGNIVV